MRVGEILLLEYEENMLGNKRGYQKALSKTTVSNEEAALVLQYVFRDILRWPPAYCENKITKDVIKKFHLEKILALIEFPIGLSKENDLYYLTSLIYPESTHYGKNQYILTIYKNILEKRTDRFPNYFFGGKNGIMTFKLCFEHAVNEYLFGASIREVMCYFANDDLASSFLKKVRLQSPAKTYYESVLDAVLDMYEKSDEALFWYNYCKFVKAWNEADTERKIKI